MLRRMTGTFIGGLLRVLEKQYTLCIYIILYIILAMVMTPAYCTSNGDDADSEILLLGEYHELMMLFLMMRGRVIYAHQDEIKTNLMMARPKIRVEYDKVMLRG